jgi:hypothetical protein
MTVYQPFDGNVYRDTGHTYTKYSQTWATYTGILAESCGGTPFMVGLAVVGGGQVTASLDMTNNGTKTFYYNVHPTSDIGTIPPGSYQMQARAGYGGFCNPTPSHWSGKLTW